MGLLDGSNEQTMGLLGAAAQMLSMGGRQNRRYGTGQVLAGGLLGGIQGYNGALEAQEKAQERDFMREYRTAQMDGIKSKSAASQNQQAALARIRQKLETDPNYKPSMAELLEVDADSAIKGLMPESAVDYGLEPKIGHDPNTGELKYFTQDKRGNTKWLAAGVPKNLKFVPGTDYQAPQVVDLRNGQITPATPGGTPSGATPTLPTVPGMAPQSAPAEPDPLAPWRNIVSPKEQDQMKQRIFEQDSKQLEALKERVSSGRRVMTDLERFGELNRIEGTGGTLDRQTWIPTMDSEKREMEAITARLAPNMRPAGSGGTSDRDIALYLQGLPGIDKPGDVNKNIRNQFAQDQANAERQLSFREQYLTDYGHLNGSYDAFKTAEQNEKSGGLDVSKLTPQQAAYLRQQNPEAFERGIARMNKNRGAQATAKAMDQLPKPIEYKGKIVRDQETGKRYKSNGLQWVEVQ